MALKMQKCFSHRGGISKGVVSTLQLVAEPIILHLKFQNMDRIFPHLSVRRCSRKYIWRSGLERSLRSNNLNLNVTRSLPAYGLKENTLCGLNDGSTRYPEVFGHHICPSERESVEKDAQAF
jgi:hypothetical protein